jgi:glycerol kinase
MGFFENLEDLRARWSVDRTWKPNMDAQRRERMYGFWKKAVTRSFDWLDSE